MSPFDDYPDSPHHGRHPLKFDGTINIPTIVMLVGMLVGGIASMVGVYNNLTDRQQQGDSLLAVRIYNNEKEIGVLKNQAADARAERDRDRQEMQATLRDINSKLDQLIWDRGTAHTGKPGAAP